MLKFFKTIPAALKYSMDRGEASSESLYGKAENLSWILHKQNGILDYNILYR